MTVQRFDVLVIGAGAGGLCAAARLAHLGYRTLVVERLERVGGRASTEDIDGFRVNNGAIILETGGALEDTFDAVGARYDVRIPKPPILYRIKGKDVDVSSGGWGLLLGKLTRSGAKLLSGLGAARSDEGMPEDDQLSTADWVARFTRSESVQGMFRNMCASVFAVGSEELPARVFLTYFTRKSKFKNFGFHPEGTIGAWEELSRTVTRDGGEVWANTAVRSLHHTAGRITGATVDRPGEAVEIEVGAVVSDVGPAGTLDLLGEIALPPEYLDAVKRSDRPCSMISINFASERPLMEVPGLLTFATTRRLCYAANFTATCPEMAPPGWHLYVGTSVPKPAVGAFDEAAELDLLRADLADELPGFEGARVLSTTITRDTWPPQRAVAGYDAPRETPLANLWNVGDGVKEYGNGGTAACAEGAALVVDALVAALPR